MIGLFGTGVKGEGRKCLRMRIRGVGEKMAWVGVVSDQVSDKWGWFYWEEGLRTGVWKCLA